MSRTEVNAGISGTVWKIEVALGQTVQEDESLMIIESMKMEIPVLSPGRGVVAEILTTEGAVVGEDLVVVVLNS
ncbi:hypothetical protein BH10PSE18_BH10PSE18_18010 [soil metagenome]|jgi:acetyl-CoA carboxylase biotin carboxyl carrier protein